ncbi:MAG TPA: sigma factor, partial [Bacteroidia bacterium]|nr:sigma factor [Bacteroidia bacterium]
MENKQQINELVDHLFRHEAGKMVAVLTRVFGFKNIEQAEDVVHDTMLKALETWKFGKIPENPQAWLYSSAKNKAIDLLRRQQLKYKIDSDISYLLKSEYTLAP